MALLGVIPARMAASRFPNKPLYPILGKPMLQHAYERASRWDGWDQLVIATCDQEIKDFATAQGFPVVMTGNHHKRALDRVAEAARILGFSDSYDDIVVNVQGDEPMMEPDMFPVLCAPIEADSEIQATVLGMNIIDEAQWRNPDTVKIIANDAGELLYTSRSAVPYNGGIFSVEMEATRIYGLFAFRAPTLQRFTEHSETRLELLEACDSNRILSMGFRQHVAKYPYIPAFSVDSPEDIAVVEAALLAQAKDK